MSFFFQVPLLQVVILGLASFCHFHVAVSTCDLSSNVTSMVVRFKVNAYGRSSSFLEQYLVGTYYVPRTLFAFGRRLANKIPCSLPSSTQGFSRSVRMLEVATGFFYPTSPISVIVWDREKGSGGNQCDVIQISRMTVEVPENKR